MLSQKRWLFHPLSVFIFSILALVASLYIYIHWYFKLYQTVERLIIKFNLDPAAISSKESWIVIIALAVLVACIIAGLIIIFVYYSKWVKLYRKQQNFFNGFTHELKTPITSLKLFLDTLEKYDLPRQKQLEYFDFMGRDVSRLESNVESILNFSRVDESKKTFEFKLIDINKSLAEVLKKNSTLLDNTDLEVVDNTHENIYLKLNPSLFDIMISNLLSNSVFHNDKKKSQIKITIDKIGSKCALKIKDNGNGLKKSELKDIFQKFYQGENSAKGSGLGLYLVKAIAKIHKGKIKAESYGDGKGSTFTLTFPIPVKSRSGHV
ncbi:MAG: sensor histidine kinase [Bacteriovoracaceae bacterium]